MSIALTTKFAPYTDELFEVESKKEIVTNNDFDWTGAHTVKIYKVTTASMNNYDRNGANAATQWSRYGAVSDLSATTEELTLSKDRSFTFAIDKLDSDETAMQVEAASALARQLRLVVVPEVDSYTFGRMASGAGTTAAALGDSELDNKVYDSIIAGAEILDDHSVPVEDRSLIVCPRVYRAIKKSPDVFNESALALEQRESGVVEKLDGMEIIRVPASHLPDGFGFMIAHKSATVAPTKLEDYTVHDNPPGISGSLVEGRICYDAFVLDNKKYGIYYQPIEDDESDS